VNFFSRGIPRLSSDVYAVGTIGIQALTGLMPHELLEDPDTAEIIWRNQVQVSPMLGDLLTKMVRYDFRQRYKSAVGFVRVAIDRTCNCRSTCNYCHF
jgi:serine/threonine-protein kinase